jgi:hypothetical protein
MSADLDRLAQELSALLTEAAVREVFVDRISSASKRTVRLGEILGELRRRDRPAPQDDVLEDAVFRIESEMKEWGLASPWLDIELPVEAHLQSLAAGDITVAVAPLADEEHVEEIVAYARGEELRLDPLTAPEGATFVLTAHELQPGDPRDPAAFATLPEPRTKPRTVDDYVGIPWIYLYDDHESWTEGDPEVYVLVRRFRISTSSVIEEKFDLPGVNAERVWYDLGDWNSTYRYVSRADYAPVVRLEFWEADSELDGGDDFMGAIDVEWAGLSPVGCRYCTAGDVRLGIDRNHSADSVFCGRCEW